MSSSSHPRRRFPARELLRFLTLPLALTIIAIVVFVKPWRDFAPARDGAYEEVRLVQKGGLSALSSLFSGPSGSVWYTPDAEQLELRMSAQNLEAGRHYIFEIQVDSTVYDVASIAADADGRIALNGAFETVSEGTCVGGSYDQPVRLEGGRSYTLAFMIKRDGNPATGSQRVAGLDGISELSCTGNGDGDYTYVLLENRLARFSAR
jgi:hypothetical protein